MAQADFSLARKMYDDGLYEAVIAHMESFEIRKVEDMMLEADAYHKLHEYEYAADWYTQVLARDSYNSQALMRRGAVYLETGEFGWALQDIKAALKITPMDPEANFYMGNICYDQGDMRNAVKYYKAALEFRPGYPQAMYMLGAAKAMQGDKRAAANAFSSIMEEMPMAMYNMAVVSLEANAYEVAVELFNKLEAHDFFASMENAMDGDFFFMRAEAKYYSSDKQGACLDYKKSADMGDHEAGEIYDEYCLKSKKKSDRKKREMMKIEL
jgi:Tfp pilus assembly protein PilF